MKRLSFLLFAILLGIVGGGGIICKGATAPQFNATNFEYVTNGAILYHFGKDGAPFSGFLGSTKKKYWDLLAYESFASRCWNSNKHIIETSSYGPGCNVTELFIFVNSYADVKINETEKQAIINRYVDARGDECSSVSYAAGSLSDAYFWLPSKTEVGQNKVIQYSSKFRSSWTRSYAWGYWGNGSNDDYYDMRAHMFLGVTSAYYANEIHPAFRLDLNKVMKLKSMSGT